VVRPPVEILIGEAYAVAGRNRVQNAPGLWNHFAPHAVSRNNSDRKGLHELDTNFSALYWRDMQPDFLRGPLGKLGTPVCRIGLSATYRPGRATIFKAIDEGVNYFFFYGFDTQMTAALREVAPRDRARFVLATGAYNYIVGHQNLRKTLEKRLRQTRAEYIDLFHFLGITKPKQFTPQVRDELQAVRESGLVRGVAVSCHDRGFAAQLVREGSVDAVMVRYNAAHRGAETEVFGQVGDVNPGIVSYTATRWRYLIRRPGKYPRDGRLPTPGMCYRFVLSNPAVHVALMAPSNLTHFQENLAEIRRGPLEEEDQAFMRSFGDVVYGRYKYFM
jgi:predicted aldo/keto reductase-like oxidoreductase